MIIEENVTINGKQGIKTFSDKNVYIADEEGILYSIAYNFIEFKKTYVETDKIIRD